MANQNQSNTIYGVLGLVILGGLGFLVVKCVILVFANLDKLNTNIIAAVLAGLFTITGYFITRYLERKKIVEQQIREQKLPIYQEFLGFIFKVFKNTKGNSNDISEEDMQKFFWEFNQKSILWLSDTTLKSYIAWRNDIAALSASNIDDKTKGIKMMLSFERLLLESEKILGTKIQTLIAVKLCRCLLWIGTIISLHSHRHTAANIGFAKVGLWNPANQLLEF